MLNYFDILISYIFIIRERSGRIVGLCLSSNRLSRLYLRADFAALTGSTVSRRRQISRWSEAEEREKEEKKKKRKREGAGRCRILGRVKPPGHLLMPLIPRPGPSPLLVAGCSSLLFPCLLLPLAKNRMRTCAHKDPRNKEGEVDRGG